MEKSDSTAKVKIWVVRVAKDNSPLQYFALKAEKAFIGRMNQNHIILDDPSVSRSHAMISRNKEKFFIIDQGSQNGTLINGKPLLRDEFRPGDLVTIGPFTLKLQEMESQEFQRKNLEMKNNQSDLTASKPGLKK